MFLLTKKFVDLSLGQQSLLSSFSFSLLNLIVSGISNSICFHALNGWFSSVILSPNWVNSSTTLVVNKINNRVCNLIPSSIGTYDLLSQPALSDIWVTKMYVAIRLPYQYHRPSYHQLHPFFVDLGNCVVVDFWYGHLRSRRLDSSTCQMHGTVDSDEKFVIRIIPIQ